MSLHQKLNNKFRFYNNWHKTKLHSHIHWGSFLGICLVVGFFVLNAVNNTYYPSQSFLEIKRAKAVAGPHDYFNSLVARSDVAASYSLRDAAQVAEFRRGSPSDPIYVTYDPANDPDPRKQDAAKIFIPETNNSLPTQVWLPTRHPVRTSLLVTWDAWWGSEFDYDNTGIGTYKAFQIGSPQEDIWTEVRSRFSMAQSDGDVAKVDVRQYGGLGPNASKYPIINGINYGSNSLGPMTNEFSIAKQIWTRYWAFFEPQADGEWYRFSLWLADENRDPVLVHSQLQIMPQIGPPNMTSMDGTWGKLRLEYNTSTMGVPAGRGPLVSYVRNVVMLKGPTLSNITSILLKPGSSGTLPPGNSLPSVSLTSPAAGQNFSPAPASLTLSANASDSDGTISKVDFYNGSTLLNSDTSSPYSYSWTNVAQGTYNLTAKAYDNAGGSTTSSVVTVTVGTATSNIPPSVSLTSPSEGQSFTAPASIILSATASDSDGSITKVNFYRGTTLASSDTSAPYSFTASNVPAGSYTFSATAFDNSGASTSTNAVSITVGDTSNNLPIGSFDEIRLSDGVIRGWTLDPDSKTASNNVQIYVDGPVGTGSLLTSFSTNILRSDVNTAQSTTGNHGFEYLIPNTYRNGLTHTVYVYGIDLSDSTKTTLLTGSPKSFTLSTTLQGDLNKDGIVNSIDWSIMNTKWLTSDATADINKDGIVNSIDFSIMNNNWLKSG